MDTFFIIVGLGNPGRKYDGSRHNAGFDVIDELVDRYHIGGPERFGKSMIGKGRIGDRKVILVKPMTYMNLSGEAVQEIVHYFKADPSEDLLVPGSGSASVQSPIPITTWRTMCSDIFPGKKRRSWKMLSRRRPRRQPAQSQTVLILQ